MPSDQDMRDDHVQDRANPDAGRRQWDSWLAAHDARVRRDALTALADHWDETVSEHVGRPLFSASGTHVRHYRDTFHPEETHGR